MALQSRQSVLPFRLRGKWQIEENKGNRAFKPVNSTSDVENAGQLSGSDTIFTSSN